MEVLQSFSKSPDKDIARSPPQLPVFGFHRETQPRIEQAEPFALDRQGIRRVAPPAVRLECPILCVSHYGFGMVPNQLAPVQLNPA